MGVEGMTVVVTGAAVGIGAAIAGDLARHGAFVVLVDVEDDVRHVAAEIGPSAAAFVGDITDPTCASDAVDKAVRQFGRVDGLANVAGVVVNGTAMTITDTEFLHSMDVNVIGSLRFIRAALPHMIARGRGSVVNFASVVGVRGRQDGVAYVTAKAAVLGLTRSVALDFGRLGVRCNSVSPGAVDTPMLRRFEERNPGVMDALAAGSYVGRIGTAFEIASLCRYLLGEESGFVNGADIVVDGGALAAYGPAREGSWDPTTPRNGRP